MGSEKEFSEGGTCPVDGCAGSLIYPEVDNCSCHLCAPCGACVDVDLECDECGESPHASQ